MVQCITMMMMMLDSEERLLSHESSKMQVKILIFMTMGAEVHLNFYSDIYSQYTKPFVCYWDYGYFPCRMVLEISVFI